MSTLSHRAVRYSFVDNEIDTSPGSLSQRAAFMRNQRYVSKATSVRAAWYDDAISEAGSTGRFLWRDFHTSSFRLIGSIGRLSCSGSRNRRRSSSACASFSHSWLYLQEVKLFVTNGNGVLLALSTITDCSFYNHNETCSTNSQLQLKSQPFFKNTSVKCSNFIFQIYRNNPLTEIWSDLAASYFFAHIIAYPAVT